MIRLLERLGVPRVLMLGFLAVAIFMTGDGFELTFLSKFMVDQRFTSSQASLLVTVYGLFAAAGGWSAGVLAEMFGARRVMMFGAYWWIGIHLLFLGVAIPSRIYPLILGLCALRGIGYPLFIYSFVVLMAQYISPSRLASATGFFWTCFSLGIGTCAFSSLPTIMTLYAGEGKQGAALSAYNLAAGLTTFAGPGIATILLPVIGYGGVCWTYAALYVLAFVLTLFIRPRQPGFDEHGHRIAKAKNGTAPQDDAVPAVNTVSEESIGVGVAAAEAV